MAAEKDYISKYGPRARRAIDMLRSADLPKWATLQHIAAETKVDINWLKRFSAGKCARPEEYKIDVLLNFFKTIKS